MKKDPTDLLKRYIYIYTFLLTSTFPVQTSGQFYQRGDFPGSSRSRRSWSAICAWSSLCQSVGGLRSFWREEHVDEVMVKLPVGSSCSLYYTWKTVVIFLNQRDICFCFGKPGVPCLGWFENDFVDENRWAPSRNHIIGYIGWGNPIKGWKNTLRIHTLLLAHSLNATPKHVALTRDYSPPQSLV